MLGHLIRYSLRRLAVRWLTTLLTTLGIGIGVANIVALISVSEIARAQAMRLMGELGANTIFVTPYFSFEESPFEQAGAGMGALPVSYYEFLRDKPYAEVVSPFQALVAFVAHKGNRVFTTVIGCTPDIFKVRPYKLASGRFYSDDETAGASEVAVLGHTVARKLFPEGRAVGQEIVLKGKRLRVVGTLEEKGRIGFEDFDNRIFIPLNLAQKLFDYPYLHTVAIKHPEGMKTEDVVKQIKQELAQWRGVDPEKQDEFSVFSMKELTRAANETFKIFAVVLLGVSCIALLVAGIGIMTVMLMSVVEQTREIGVRRAVGARRRDILVQFFIETLLQVVAGQVVGFILGAVGVYILCAHADWTFFITGKTIILALGFSFGVGIVFSILPAFRAATLDPVESLRYE